MKAHDNQLLLPAPPERKLLPAPQSRWKRHPKAIVAGSLALLLLVAFAVGWVLHHRRAEAAEQSNESARDTLPMVNVAEVTRSPSLSDMLLPGSLTPIADASLYARAAGYVKHRYVDIGDPVKQGQVLAEIESPELDQQVVQGLATAAQARQQLNQVRSTVGDARAKLDLARIATQRWDVLAAANAVPAQEADQRRQEYQSALAALASAEANVGAATENVRAADANRKRLAALQQFEKLRAPFDGVVTARYVDEGALVGSTGGVGSGGTGISGGTVMATSSSTGSTSGGSGSTGGTSSSGSDSSQGSSSSGATPLFRISRLDRLRVYINVPQGNSTAVQTGSDATVMVQEFAEPFAGRVSRTARSLDPSSRTLLTEVQIDNSRNTLMPGMYAQVRLTSTRANAPVLVPGEALIVRADGVQVATIAELNDEERRRLPESADKRCARQIRFAPVALGRDYGTEVEVASGLKGGEFVILNPGDTTRNEAIALPSLRPEGQQGEQGRSNQKGGAGGGSEKDKTKKDKDDGKAQGSEKGDDKKPGSGGAAGKGDDEQRRHAQQSCIEQQAAAEHQKQQQQPNPGRDGAASQPAGSASQAGPGGPSDGAPAGLQSPSMKAPTQGAKK